MTVTEGEATFPSLGDPDNRRIQVTPGRVAVSVVGIQILVLAIVGLERLGIELPVLREVVGVVYLSVVPGYLLLRIAGIRDESRIETIVYSVGLSLVSLMVAGVLANFALQQIGVNRPIAELPMVLSLAVFVGVLTLFYLNRVDDVWEFEVDLRQLSSPSVLALTLLPFVGVYGALVLTRYSNNVLLVALYAVLLVLPLLVIADRVPAPLVPYLVWIIAITLLLQNSLSGHYMAWGDSPKEATLALDVLRNGYWKPALAPGYGSKYSMLRIVILHPIYALVTDLKFVWVFKVIHPLIFSLTPLALYRAYEHYTEQKTAFLSAFLYMSLFSFFIVLSRNTRTATALFFMALFVLLVANNRIPLSRRKILALLFVAGIVVSHYGASYMFMLALALVIVLRPVLERLFSGISTDAPLTSPIFVLFYGTMLFGWYIYASPRSKAFNLLLGFANSFIGRLTDQFVADPESTSATTRYLTSDFTSATLNTLKLYNVLVGGIIIVGLGLTYWQLIKDNDVSFNSEYMGYASIALMIFGITFLPVERFNTARTYPTTLLFFAPFFVVGIREALRLARRHIPKFSIEPTYRIAVTVLVVFLALNVGFVSATITHEYSTNALVEKDRIMDDGHPTEKSYFYKQYPTTFGVAGTDWLQTVAQNDSALYMSNWPGGLKRPVGHSSLTGSEAETPYFRGQIINREMIANDTDVPSGYVFLSAFSHERLGNVIRLPSGHFGFEYTYTNRTSDHWEHKNLVYANGGTKIYYGS